ncbi:Glucose-6-phosphate isomerase [Candidatus Bodocaedibacter vickermanii]|uniref:Glucose-6-phosphate isomerase n=2 Tax=Candidatus Bodocaedibacter vickermanii TaxID=2741701 RepID=A0A7L9RTZ1_9PROT|nr:Glucose-6-phosphate isomerase [Candidatus Paracaedibacteraceae bacterium 'Lake Konstanz']
MININTDHLKQINPFEFTQSLSTAVRKFKDVHSNLPMFRLQENLKKVLAYGHLAEKTKERFTDIVLLGTGGSSLGAQVLCKLSRLEDDIRIHFFDNIDPLTFKHFWEKSRLETTLFLVISKSGTTPETLTQAIIAIARVESVVGKNRISDHFIVVTEPKSSPLKKLADRYGFMCIDHDQGIGGRFSALSLVGLLPAMLMSVPVDRVISGAQTLYTEFLLNPETHPITESVGLMHQTAQTLNLTQTVFMTYVDQLEPLGRWFRQLWAESLGKNGKGTTPINATGTVDQHSQLQLYLDGPKDKLFTLITHPLNWVGDQVSTEISHAIGFEDMSGRTMGDLMQAEQSATIQVLKNNTRPTRIIEITEVSPEVVGALMMQLILETLLTADVMSVNCFDQPAVEQGKILARKYLEKSIG